MHAYAIYLVLLLVNTMYLWKNWDVVQYTGEPYIISRLGFRLHLVVHTKYPVHINCMIARAIDASHAVSN